MKILVVIVALVDFAAGFEICGKKGASNRIVNGVPSRFQDFKINEFYLTQTPT